MSEHVAHAATAAAHGTRKGYVTGFVLSVLLTAIPFCVLTADPRVSAWLRRHRVAAIPEEFSSGQAACRSPA